MLIAQQLPHSTGHVQARGEPTAFPDRRHLAKLVGATIAITAVLDAVVLTLAVMWAWSSREFFDIWSTTPVRYDHVVSDARPYVVGAWLLVLVAQGAYSTRHFAAGAEEFRLVTLASFLAAGLVGLACYLLQLPLSRGFLILTFVLGTPLLLLERYAVRKVVHRAREHGRLVHRVIAVGGPSGISEVVDALGRDSYVGYEVVGVCLPEGIEADPDDLVVPVLGPVEGILRLCDEVGADTVLVARGGYATARELRRIAWALEGSSVDLVVVPSLTDVAGPRIHIRPVAGLPLLHVEQPQAGAAAGIPKRVFDVVGALGALLVLAPLMLTVAALIRLGDGGPIFYQQARIGRDGRRFGCHKFRSMIVDADKLEEGLRQETGHAGALWKMDGDPRTTRVGAFIRRYSIDELPQLLNVVTGQMSLVGPRPQQAWEVETYTDWEGRRLRVRPGMTGLWQVSGRSQLSFDEAIRLDLYYVDNWSMVSDLVIMARTVKAVFSRSGAY